MTGWIALALLVALVLAALWLARVRGALFQMIAAAAMIGAAGYALQGRPSLPEARPPAAQARPILPLTEARQAFFGTFSGSEHWHLLSESMARRGRTADAVGVLRSAVREHPRDIQLWIGLGNAMVDHAGVLTPGAELAYARAAELAPDHPAPPFFYGLALARSGDRAAAIATWQKLLADAPADAGWRPLVEDGVRVLAAPPTPQTATPAR